MKVTANIATMPSRVSYLEKMLKSIDGQFDEIRVYLNGFTYVPECVKKCAHDYTFKGEDLTDNGKFFYVKPNEYYFTMDDDLEYPPTYAKDMVEAIKRTGSIVSHHGRRLIGLNLSYYRGHINFRCLDANTHEGIIDVCGTGVSAFDTNYFCPKIWDAKDRLMSDLVFALEAAKQDKKITILKHEKGYIKYLYPDESKTISGMYGRKETRQIQIANEVFTIRKGLHG